MTQDPIKLLAEWFDWRSKNDSAPAKMPNSLHTRTVVCLSEARKLSEIDEALNVAPMNVPGEIVGFPLYGEAHMPIDPSSPEGPFPSR